MPRHTERTQNYDCVQVLAKSCKPIPVMLMGALMGKQYPVKKYVNVIMIVSGVALFMYSGDGSGKPNAGSGGQVSCAH
jgi:solute carrier family 35 (UDP-galactose transporter), member B1